MYISPDIQLIFGQPQSGKTTRVRTRTRDLPRVLYYDTAGHDYTEGLIVESLPALKDVWHRSYRGDFRLIYRPVGPTREERKRTHKIDPEFSEVCSLVRACGEMTFVVEEVDLYVEAGECDDEFMDLLRRGQGHYDVNLIVVTQMPQGIGRGLKALAHDWTIFQTRDPDHIAYFGRRCSGIDPADIKALQPHEYIHYHDGHEGYWICRDDLTTGQTQQRQRDFVYDRTLENRTVANSGNVVSLPTLEDKPHDGPEGMPAPQDKANSPQ